MGHERLPRRAYEWELRREERNWSTYTEELLRELNLEEHWERQEVKENKKEWNEKIRVFIIYRLLSWGMKFDHRTIVLTKDEENVLASCVNRKTQKI